MKIRVIIAVMILKKGPEFFLGFTFTTASVALIPAKNNFVFKMKQGGETGKCLLTKHFLLGHGLTAGSNPYTRERLIIDFLKKSSFFFTMGICNKP